jgi:hypothetical protein
MSESWNWSWIEVLKTAGEATPLSIEAASRLIAAFSHGDLRAALAADGRRLELQALLENTDLRRLTPRVRVAARAALRTLPRASRAVLAGVQDEGILADVQGELERRARTDSTEEQRAVELGGQLCCPRCASARVDEWRTDRGSDRYTQLLCLACGRFGDWMRGAFQEASWEVRP